MKIKTLSFSKDEIKIINTVNILLVEHSKEASLFWIRFNIYLLINTALLGFIFNFMSTSSNYAPFLLIVTTIFGVLICSIWLIVTKRGRKLFSHWFEDAQELVYCSRSRNIRKTFKKSLMMRSYIRRKNKKLKKFSNTEKFCHFFNSVTKPSILIILIFGLLWIIIPVYFYNNPPQTEKSVPNKTIITNIDIDNTSINYDSNDKTSNTKIQK